MTRFAVLASLLLFAIASPAAKVPSEAELKSVLAETLQTFNAAVQTGDFTAFRKSVATFWQNQATPYEFGEMFSQFRDPRAKAPFQKVVDHAIASEPKFDPPPKFGEHGELIVNAIYPIEPPFPVRATYLKEGSSWKLIAIKLDAEVELARLPNPPPSQ
jgi:hypothetical protein